MKTKRAVKYISIFFLLSIFIFAIASPAGAYELKSGETVVVEEGEVIDDDLYVGANQFELKGTIKGDLIVAGTSITIAPTGIVEGDFMATGQSVIIQGEVGDDVRIAGAALALGDSASVGDDFIGAGYSLETNAGSSIGGSILFYGAQALLNGDVAGDVTVGVGGLEIDGQVGGNLEADVGTDDDVPPFSPLSFIPNMPAVPSVKGGLNIGPNARIEGSLNYTSPAELDVPTRAVEGQITHEEPEVELEEPEPEPSAAEKSFEWILRLVRRYISLLLVGLLMIWLVPTFFKNGAEKLQTKTWPSLGWGVLTFVGFFVVIAVLFLTTVALTVFFGLITLASLAWLSFGIGFITFLNLLLAFIIATAFVAKILVSYLVGKLIIDRIRSDDSGGLILSLVVGLFVLAILISIPILGWLIGLAITFFGLGAIVLILRDMFFGEKDTLIQGEQE